MLMVVEVTNQEERRYQHNNSIHLDKLFFLFDIVRMFQDYNRQLDKRLLNVDFFHQVFLEMPFRLLLNVKLPR